MASLDARIYPEGDCISGEDYLTYREQGNQVWLLELDGNWIGNFQVSPVAAVSDVPAPLRGKGWYLSGIGVFEGFQGQGHGTRLMTEAVDRFGGHRMLGRIRIGNTRSVRVSLRAGFSPRMNQTRDGVVWVWFERESGWRN